MVGALTNEELRALAPEPFAAWDTVLASVDGAVMSELVALVRAEVAAALGEAPAPEARAERRECRALRGPICGRRSRSSCARSRGSARSTR